MKIRLARGGSKKRPFYSIVASDSRMPRDGRFIEKLGTYNPLLPKDSEERVKMDTDRVKHWLEKGAQPTDRISRMLEAAGVLEKKTRANPQKGTPGKAAQERAAAKVEKAEKAAEAAAAPAKAKEAAPAEAPAEEAAPAEAPAEEVAEAEAPAEEAAPAEAPSEEAAEAEAPAEAPAEEAAEKPTEKAAKAEKAASE
jgi:small subunit ribosomal protein S16